MATPTVNPMLAAFALDPPALMTACGLPPDPWQKRLLRSQAKRVLVLSCRQCGKSTSTAALALQHILTAPRSLVVMVSASHDQSKELFLKMHDMYDALGRPLKPAKENTTELRLANRARALSLPANPDTVRGYSKASLVICDEAAVMDDAMFTSVAPMRAVGEGRLILISTPKGQRGYFHREWEHGGDAWERYRITAGECPRISPEFLAGERRTMRESEFLQEWFCLFTQADDQYFSTESIDRAFENAPPPLFNEPL